MYKFRAISGSAWKMHSLTPPKSAKVKLSMVEELLPSSRSIGDFGPQPPVQKYSMTACRLITSLGQAGTNEATFVKVRFRVDFCRSPAGTNDNHSSTILVRLRTWNSTPCFRRQNTLIALRSTIRLRYSKQSR